MSPLRVQKVNDIYRFVTILITILDNIRSPVFYLKYDVSKAGFCLRLQVKPTQVGPIVRASLGRHRLALSIGPT
jgi:hypothetical protein